MRILLRVTTAALLCLVFEPAIAQNAVRWSGLFYLDYEYLVTSADEEADGENAFGYRRLYLTADYDLSEEFTGRARLEAQSESGDSYPFVKDMYLRWNDAIADGHDLTFGVQSPPVFVHSERVWGYRSLERTILDRVRVASSRDMGILARGKVTSDGNLTYALMLANNNGVRGEDDRYKRVYGQLAWRSDKISASLGSDYAAGEDRDATTANAFAGYTGTVVTVGVEGFFQRTDFDAGTPSRDHKGVSLFVLKPVSETVELVGRVDLSERELGATSQTEVYVLGGVSISPNRKVHFIPNVFLVDVEGRSDPELVGRVTLHADF